MHNGRNNFSHNRTKPITLHLTPIKSITTTITTRREPPHPKRPSQIANPLVSILVGIGQVGKSVSCCRQGVATIQGLLNTNRATNMPTTVAEEAALLGWVTPEKKNSERLLKKAENKDFRSPFAFSFRFLAERDLFPVPVRYSLLPLRSAVLLHYVASDNGFVFAICCGISGRRLRCENVYVRLRLFERCSYGRIRYSCKSIVYLCPSLELLKRSFYLLCRLYHMYVLFVICIFLILEYLSYFDSTLEKILWLNLHW